MTYHDGEDRERTERSSRREILKVVGGSLAAGTTAGLAGCPGTGGLTSASATPVVLYPGGQELFGVSAFRIEEETKTVSPADLGEVSLTSYLAVHGKPKEHEQSIPMRFGVSEPGAHALGILAMPAPSALGRELNPLAEQPLGEILTSERGRRFLDQTEAVDTPEFEWTRGPSRVGRREVEFMESAATAESYYGVATDDDDSRTVLATLARVEHEGDVVLVGEFLWRQTPSKPLDADAECTDSLCQIPEETLEAIAKRFASGGPYISSCPGLATQVGADISTVCSGTGVPDTGPHPKFGIKNARVVQHVENTDVEGTGSPRRVFHEEPDPDLVKGENTAVVFEFDTLEHLGKMFKPQPLEIDIYSGAPSSNAKYENEGTVEIGQSDLQKIKNQGHDTVAVLHRVSNDGKNGNDLPVFDLETGEIKVSPNTSAHPGYQTTGVSKTISVSSKRIRDLEPLKVGFIPVRDTPTADGLFQTTSKSPGDRYGNNNGMPRDPLRTFESETEYLQRVYPGDVVTYLHQNKPFPGTADSNDAIRSEMGKVKEALNNIATGGTLQKSNFPSGGTLRLDGTKRSKMVNAIKNSGFDATVAIVPGVAVNNSGVGDYYEFHGKPAGWVGLAFGSGQAVSTVGVNPSSGNDQGVSSTVAQEVGHFFQDNYLQPTYQNKPDHPMAQRRDPSGLFHKTVNGKPLDKSHARHKNSNNDGVSSTDVPGVVSVAYDLEGGFANMQHYRNSAGNFTAHGPGATYDCGDKDGCQSNPTGTIEQVPSYMSYTGQDAKVWADARIHQQLIETGVGKRWDAGLFGSGNANYMVAAKGSVSEDGGVEYGAVRALRGVERYVDGEDNPVEVSLQGPDGESLASARVPVKIYPTHGHAGDTAPKAPSFLLPFEMRGVRVRTTYQGQTTFMNPIVRSVRDAVERVPERGFASDSRQPRERILEALDEVAALMQRGSFAEAATVMDGRVRTRVSDAVVEYDARLDQRTPQALNSLIDRMVERLEAASG